MHPLGLQAHMATAIISTQFTPPYTGKRMDLERMEKYSLERATLFHNFWKHFYIYYLKRIWYSIIIAHAKLCHLIIHYHHHTGPVWSGSISQQGTRDIRACQDTTAQWGQPTAATSGSFRGLKKEIKYMAKCSLSCCCLHIIKRTTPFLQHFTGRIEGFAI